MFFFGLFCINLWLGVLIIQIGIKTNITILSRQNYFPGLVKAFRVASIVLSLAT